MKNKINSSLLTVILLAGLNANAQAAVTPVDNSVKYGEKYSCAITTTDQKNYTLDIDWQVEPAKYSKIPKWEEKLIYSLILDSVQVDNGYFSDLGFSYGKTEFTFNYDKYIFAASASLSTRVGTNFNSAHIELEKSYDKDAKTVLKVSSFSSIHEFDKFYGSGGKTESINLVIQDSNCSVDK